MKPRQILGVGVLIVVAIIAIFAMDHDGSSAPPKQATQPASGDSQTHSQRPKPSPAAKTPPPASSARPSADRPGKAADRRVTVAIKAARAFARPETHTDTNSWFESLRPLLAEDYAAEAAYIDPNEVPFTRITGSGHIADADGDVPARLLTLVKVPTDAGPWAVEITDTDVTGPHVTAIYPWHHR